MKAAASYDKVLTKIATGAYKNLAGAAGARAITSRVLQSTQQSIVKITAWKSFSKGLKFTAEQSFMDFIKAILLQGV